MTIEEKIIEKYDGVKNFEKTVFVSFMRSFLINYTMILFYHFNLGKEHVEQVVFGEISVDFR